MKEFWEYSMLHGIHVSKDDYILGHFLRVCDIKGQIFLPARDHAPTCTITSKSV